jgi:DNA invertase Pin-like site-specific DNA recombinase
VEDLRAPAAAVGARRRIDTTTPGGNLVFHVVAALAEFERDLIRRAGQQ